MVNLVCGQKIDRAVNIQGSNEQIISHARYNIELTLLIFSWKSVG